MTPITDAQLSELEEAQRASNEAFRAFYEGSSSACAKALLRTWGNARHSLNALATSRLPSLIARIKAAEEFATLIDSLRADGGDAVTILCDNPDFVDRPCNAIECNGGWTDWQDRRFSADTLIDCLRAAVSARAALEGQPK